MAAPRSDDRHNPDAIKARRDRWLAIAKEHPDWPRLKIQNQCIKELGAGVAPETAKELHAEARGIDLSKVKGRLTWRKAQAMLASGGGSNGKPAARSGAAPPSPTAPPARRGRVTGDRQANALAALRLLVEAMPGLRTVTINEDGSAEFTMREVIERKGRLKL